MPPALQFGVFRCATGFGGTMMGLEFTPQTRSNIKFATASSKPAGWHRVTSLEILRQQVHGEEGVEEVSY